MESDFLHCAIHMNIAEERQNTRWRMESNFLHTAMYVNIVEGRLNTRWGIWNTSSCTELSTWHRRRKANWTPDTLNWSTSNRQKQEEFTILDKIRLRRLYTRWCGSSVTSSTRLDSTMLRNQPCHLVSFSQALEYNRFTVSFFYLLLWLQFRISDSRRSIRMTTRFKSQDAVFTNQCVWSSITLPSSSTSWIEKSQCPFYTVTSYATWLEPPKRSITAEMDIDPAWQGYRHVTSIVHQWESTVSRT